jgi:hypothetical protein
MITNIALITLLVLLCAVQVTRTITTILYRMATDKTEIKPSALEQQHSRGFKSFVERSRYLQPLVRAER